MPQTQSSTNTPTQGVPNQMPDIMLDTPAQISGWYYMSAVSQLTLEIKTGQNYYGKRSVYSGIRGRIIPEDMVPARATRTNKIMALTMLCHDQQPGAVINSARALLDTIATDEGIAFGLVEVPQTQS